MRKKILIAAVTAALAFSTLPALATPNPSAIGDERTMGPFGCGRLYLEGFTTGTYRIWVHAAGGFNQMYSRRPATVSAVGDHSGYITSYASEGIVQWGKSGCSQL